MSSSTTLFQYLPSVWVVRPTFTLASAFFLKFTVLGRFFPPSSSDHLGCCCSPFFLSTGRRYDRIGSRPTLTSMPSHPRRTRSAIKPGPHMLQTRTLHQTSNCSFLDYDDDCSLVSAASWFAPNWLLPPISLCWRSAPRQSCRLWPLQSRGTSHSPQQDSIQCGVSSYASPWLCCKAFFLSRRREAFSSPCWRTRPL